MEAVAGAVFSANQWLWCAILRHCNSADDHDRPVCAVDTQWIPDRQLGTNKVADRRGRNAAYMALDLQDGFPGCVDDA